MIKMSPRLKTQFLCMILFSLLAAYLFPGLAESAPAYPNRPVEMIVGFGPGGAAERAARLVLDMLAGK